MKINTDSMQRGDKKKAVFLDRDGILNVEIGDYIMRREDFRPVEGIIEVLHQLKKAGYHLIVITNQAGIAKGLYTHELVHELHELFQEWSDHVIDHYYYAPGHPNYSESLSRKPDSLLFEKAMAKYNLDPAQCWMVGDKERDLVPAAKFGMQTVRLFLFPDETEGDHSIHDVRELPGLILGQ